MSSNPLMTAPRERVIPLYSGDVEAKIEELKAAINKSAGLPPRAGRKSPALAAAEEFDAFVAEQMAAANKVVLHEVSGRVVDQLRDEHPPRPDKPRDKALGVNEETFYWALVRAAMVSPVVTDEQWDEFVASASIGRRKELVEAAEELSSKVASLPKSSAVSALRRMLGSGSTQLDDTE